MSDQDRTCDLLVIGSGAGGLSTAVTAAWLGLDVVVLEKEPVFGGTTAWSGGWLWVPGNELAVSAGIVEPRDKPRQYMKTELGDGYDGDLVDMYLEQGPKMVSFFRSQTSVDFIDGNRIPDFHAESDGGALGGRSVCAAPFDGRLLGARLHDLKPPLEEVAPFGMNIASGQDLRNFLNATRSLPAFVHAARRLTRHFLDLARFRRGMHLVNGNALVARLLKSADDLGVDLVASAPVVGLLREGVKVIGATATINGQITRLMARRGVVLATGGFPHDPLRMAELFAHAPTGREHHSAAPASNTGDGLRLGETVGGIVRRDLKNAGAWSPVSLVPHHDGRVGRYPHLIERAKPGAIMVLRDGRRFTNEANSYHDVMEGLFAATPAGRAAEAWLLCDHHFIRRYGLGRVRPRPFPIGPWVRNSYLKRGETLKALASQCGIDAVSLERTVERYNRFASKGEDPEFGRGETAYNRVQGDAENQPNPCVAPLHSAPFYAVKIVPGSLGSFAGLRTDPHARVLDDSRQPIAGLYAVGNDMSSIMAGRYPSGGITLGPAMTFGYVAAHDAAGVPLDNNHSSTTEERDHALRDDDAYPSARSGRQGQ